MARNPPDQQPHGPSISREKVRIRLKCALKGAKQLLQEQPLTRAHEK